MLARWRGVVPWLQAFVIAALLGAVARPFGGLPVAKPAAPKPVVADPGDVHSTTHEPNVSSTNNVVEVAWSSPNNVLGYSFKWSQLAGEVPDTIADVSGTSIGTISARLSPGSWYFHLRTQGESGEWTSSVHLGPFVIVSPEPPPPPPPLVSITNARSDESDDSTEAKFVLSLSKKSNKRVSVDYATSNGTAEARRDYKTRRGTLSFKPGQRKRPLSIPINGDNRDEPNETFFVKLSDATNARIKDRRGRALIIDDDLPRPPPSLVINDSRVKEGTGTSTTLEFNVRLSRAIKRRVRVDFATVAGTADGGKDFDRRHGTLRFARGETRETLTVVVHGDDTDEGNEAFFVDLSGAVRATIDDARGEGTIVDDDRPPKPPPAITINDITFEEGDEGRKRVRFTVSLSRRADERVAVDFATADGSAMASEDYVTRSGRIAIGPGQRRRVFTITVIGDKVDESHENFFVVLSNPTGARIADRRGRATILDDENPPRVRQTVIFRVSRALGPSR